MKNFRTKEWLVENMSQDDLVILDARAELNHSEAGYEQYKSGHIVGAQYVSLEEDLTGEVQEHGGRHPLPDLKEFADHMMSLGVGDSSTVVIYDNGDLAMAGRLWWLLKYIGLEKVYILEGGYRDWEASGMETTQEVIRPEKSTSLSINIQDSILADIKEVKKAIDLNNIAIIDSRANERYSGKVEPLDRIPGHIPTALNYPWVDLIKENKKDIDQLNKYFEDLFKFDEILVHCGSGVTGTVNILFMEEIGLKPKLYAGGYSDWVSYEGNKVISKDNKEVIIE